MENKNPAFDDYIETAAPFAQPILQHLRNLAHSAHPGLNETLKWGFPHFDYKGMVFHMAAFKQHCTFGFWKASLLTDPQAILTLQGKTAMGHLGQIKSLGDLPADDILVAYIREAIQLNEDNRKVAAKPKAPAGETKNLEVPDYLLEALQTQPEASTHFQKFSRSQQKEYVDWLVDAKTEATRNKRLETALEWLAEGKIRNWKYAKK
jgi:uncharacterized protein YdeI (YjbR/CyaY-like superfamily)